MPNSHIQQLGDRKKWNKAAEKCQTIDSMFLVCNIEHELTFWQKKGSQIPSPDVLNADAINTNLMSDSEVWAAEVSKS
jgi:hypothetical protein